LEINKSKIEQLETKEKYFQDILERIPNSILRRSSGIIFAIFLIIIVGTKFIKYPEVLESDILITSPSPPVEVYSRATGRLVQVFSKNLDTVKKGEWVIVLNSAANYLDVQVLLKQVGDIELSDFLTSLGKIDLNPNLLLGEMQGTYYSLIKSIKEFKLFESLQAQKKQLRVNSNRKSGLSDVKKNLEDQLDILDNQLSIAKKDLDRNIQLNKEKTISDFDLEQKKIEYLNIKTRIESLKGTILNSDLQAELLKKENISLDVEKEDSYFKFTSSILQYYNALLLEISDWKNKYVIISPIDGVINFYDLRGVDQYTAAEQKVFTITPVGNQLYYGLSKFPVANSGKIKIGQNCTIKLHNYPYTEFGFIKGTINSISTAPREGFYSIRIDLPNQIITTSNKKLPPSADLVGNVSIIIEDITLFDRLFNILK
jgi:multidrug resistance efflux pump